ncbi:MAG: nuclear transport factor 2 family protein [Actinomycetota bacterium]
MGDADIVASVELRALTERWTNALLEGDEAFVRRVVSRLPVALIVGTDDTHWAEGHDEIVRALSRMMRELRPTRLLEARIGAYRKAETGWSYARVTLAIPQVGELGLRSTSVFVREDGEWRLVQHHTSVGA